MVSTTHVTNDGHRCLSDSNNNDYNHGKRGPAARNRLPLLVLHRCHVLLLVALLYSISPQPTTAGVVKEGRRPFWAPRRTTTTAATSSVMSVRAALENALYTQQADRFYLNSVSGGGGKIHKGSIQRRRKDTFLGSSSGSSRHARLAINSGIGIDMFDEVSEDDTAAPLTENAFLRTSTKNTMHHDSLDYNMAETAYLKGTAQQRRGGQECESELDFLESSLLHPCRRITGAYAYTPTPNTERPKIRQPLDFLAPSDAETGEEATGLLGEQQLSLESQPSLTAITPMMKTTATTTTTGSALGVPTQSNDPMESLATPGAASLPLPSSTTTTTSHQHQQHRGGATAAAVVAAAKATATVRPLVFWENMICGAISRSVAQTIMHPANTMKTILQSSRTPPTLLELSHPRNFPRLMQGAGANLILSIPHGAVNFAVLELVRKKLAELVEQHIPREKNSPQLDAGLDFLSSCISTISCSIVATPQMVVTDNIMAGNYPHLFAAIGTIAQQRGVMGFYRGWWPGLVGKIPAYALTWTFFQQLKHARDRWSDRAATNVENSIMGSIASAATVCIMIPVDTIKTRLVTQGSAIHDPYKGIIDCAIRVFREEGVGSFYRGLPPRLISVVPMIGIQFGVYEFMKRIMLERHRNRTAAAAAAAAAAAGTVKSKVPRIPPHVDTSVPPKSKKQNSSVESASKAAAAAAVAAKPKRQPPADDVDANEDEAYEEYGPEQVIEEAAMEVAASPEHPYPAPHFLHRMYETNKKVKEVPKGWWNRMQRLLLSPRPKLGTLPKRI